MRIGSVKSPLLSTPNNKKIKGKSHFCLDLFVLRAHFDIKIANKHAKSVCVAQAAVWLAFGMLVSWLVGWLVSLLVSFAGREVLKSKICLFLPGFVCLKSTFCHFYSK